MNNSKQKVYDTVKQVLQEKPETRDNDMYLTATIWYRDLKGRPNVGDLSVVGFFHIMRDYKTWGLWSYETITRQRRLVQEACPELRGQEYARRHKKQHDVKNDLRNIKAEAFFGPTTTFTEQVEYGNKPDENLLSGQLTMGHGHE